MVPRINAPFLEAFFCLIGGVYMVEKWKLALKEFLKKYEDDPDVVGAVLCGSYATQTQNEYSDIDVYLVLKDDCNYSLRGNVDSNSYLIEYFMNTKEGILNYMEEEFNDNKQSTCNMFAYGKVIYDLDGSVKELQDKAIEYIDKPFNEITASKLDNNNYHLWDYMDELKVSLKENNPQFNLIYYKLLYDMYDVYAEYLSIPKLPKTKIYKILTDEEYQRKCHIFKLADEEFIKLYIRCFEIEKPNLMYKNIEGLINYYYKKQGGFNIRAFELKN